MKIAVGNLTQVISEFFQPAVMPAAQKAGGALPFAVGFVGGAICRNAPQMIEQYLPAARALGLIDEENKLDIDLFHDLVAGSLEQNPLTLFGYQLDKDDLEKLREIMNKYGG